MPMLAAFSTITTLEAAAAAQAATAAAAAATTAAPTVLGLGAGSGALTAGMTGASLAPTVAATAPGITAPLTTAGVTELAAASPEIAANLTAAGAPQGIMQGATPVTSEAVQQAAVNAGVGSGYPSPTATTGAVPEGAVEISTNMQNAGDVIRAAQPDRLQNAEQIMRNAQLTGTPQAEPPINLEGNMTGPMSQVRPEFAGGEARNFLERGFNLAKDFASDAYEGYKKAPTSLQYLGAGLAAKKLGLFGQNEQPGKPTYKKQDMSQFRAWSPSPYPVPGRAGFADGGPVEAMSNMNAGIATAPGMNTTGGNMYYPMSQQPRLAYTNPGIQNPISQNVLDVGGAGRLDPYTGMPSFAEGGVPNYKALLEGKTPDELKRDADRARATAEAGGFGIIRRSRTQELSSPATAAQAELAAMMKKYGIKSALPKIKDPQESMADVQEAASGGIMHGLGGYSDGGRLLKGPGDGVSDSIPAMIGDKQPARLADGEFVVPARIVSELGNGSTEAGARKLYGMMDRVQKKRKKSVGKGKVAVDSKADKHLPA